MSRPAELSELFLHRSPGVVLHGSIDEAGEVCVTLQVQSGWSTGDMARFGLVIVTAPPAECILDTSRSPPALAIGEAMFPLDSEHVSETAVWLAGVRREVSNHASHH